MVGTHYAPGTDADKGNNPSSSSLLIRNEDNTATLMSIKTDMPETVIDISNINEPIRMYISIGGGYRYGDFALRKCVFVSKIPQDPSTDVNLLLVSQSDCEFNLSRQDNTMYSYGGSFTIASGVATLSGGNNHGSSGKQVYCRTIFPYVDASKFNYLIINSTKTIVSGDNKLSSWSIQLIDNSGNVITTITIGSRQIIDISAINTIVHIFLILNQDYSASRLTVTECVFTNNPT